mmetsp:Transcript_84293/g.252823  ORF Transcript_84293/g.252823 Transcript_84293/m.252823 type:complete len:129 (-) Transcript_84293:1423-1809(-)
MDRIRWFMVAHPNAHNTCRPHADIRWGAHGCMPNLNWGAESISTACGGCDYHRHFASSAGIPSPPLPLSPTSRANSRSFGSSVPATGASVEVSSMVLRWRQQRQCTATERATPSAACQTALAPSITGW